MSAAPLAPSPRCRRLATAWLVPTLSIATWAVGCSSSEPAAAPTQANATPDAATSPTSSGELSLEAGEVAELTLDGAHGQVHLAAGGTYGLVIVSTDFAAATTGTTTFSLATDADGDDSPAKKVEGCALAPWAGAKAAPEAEPTGTGPALGATRKIRVTTKAGSETIDAKAIAVGKRAIVWADQTPAHPAVLDAAFVDAFLKDFDDLILPRERALFGVESDLDGDGRIGLVFTPLTKGEAVAFFNGCDVIELAGCKKGNAGEYLYLTPPADIAPPYNTAAAIKETLAHELGHLVHFNRKVKRNALTSWPDSAYMIEGFGGFTQDVSGFQAGNLYVAKAGLDKVDEVSLGDVLGTRDAYDTTRDGSLRGGGYWFVRYVYDRAGGDTVDGSGAIVDKGGPSLLRALLDSPKSIADGLAERAPAADLATDFYTALLLSNASKGAFVDPKNACFSFAPAAPDPLTQKPRGGDPRAEFHGQKMTGPATKPLKAGSAKLRAGGVTYFVGQVSAGGALRFDGDAKAKPRLRIARLQ